MIQTNCKKCHKALKSAVINDETWMCCRNPFCERYEWPIEKVPESKVGDSKSKNPRLRPPIGKKQLM